MLGNGTSGRYSAISEQLKLGLGARTFLRIGAACLLGLLWMAPQFVQAQSAESSISAYAEAIKKSTIAERITAMDHYLTLAGGSRLKVDALEFLIWDHLRLDHQAQSMQRARELIAVSPGNPIAIAVLNQNPSSMSRGKAQVQGQLAALKSAMDNLDRLNKPEGMADRNFQVLRQQVSIMLTGATGLCYLELEDYPDARLALEQAVNNDPNNAALVYGFGLALLGGKNRDQYRGYWYLARATNLTGNTPGGQQIANYARETYRKDGGKDEGWNRFLASAAALDAPPNPDGTAATPRSVTAANNRAVAPAPSSAAANSNRNTSNRNTTTATQSPSQSAQANAKQGTINKTKSSAGFEATLREPVRPESVPTPAPPNRPKVIAAPSEALSLGIMIETSLLTNENRAAIIATLRDIVTSLRSNDEACILVFSDQLDFEQDLTADDKLLVDAISQIRPRSGKALLPGIAFAAGHLKRIGKNANRVLLVISDGRSSQADADAVTFRSQVTGVRIDCLGFKADGASERDLLTRLASYTGGKATFASDSGTFRTAALEMTRTLGIAVR